MGDEGRERYSFLDPPCLEAAPLCTQGHSSCPMAVSYDHSFSLQLPPLAPLVLRVVTSAYIS